LKWDALRNLEYSLLLTDCTLVAPGTMNATRGLLDDAGHVADEAMKKRLELFLERFGVRVERVGVRSAQRETRTRRGGDAEANANGVVDPRRALAVTVR
jgi:hypothetical protein